MTPVSEFTLGRLQAELAEIEATQDLRILFAVDTGPRGAGFHSQDSLYTIRFVYTRPTAWHYRLGQMPDMVEFGTEGTRDVTGWQLSRVLSGLLVSNAVVAEWLRSPVHYVEHAEAHRALSILAEQALDRTTVTQHYISQLRRARPEAEVDLGRYLALLRQALVLRWMRVTGAAMPPFDITALAEGADLTPSLEERLNFVWMQKTTQPEGTAILEPDAELDALIADERAQAEVWVRQTPNLRRPDLRDDADALHLALSTMAVASEVSRAG